MPTVPPAAERPTPRATAPKAKRGAKVKPDPITDEDKQAICASAASMKAWLQFGIGKLRHPDQEHAPTAANWAHSFNHDIDHRVNWKGHVNAASWTEQQLAAFYWWRVSIMREALSTPLSLPDWGKLGRIIKQLLKTRSIADTCEYLHVLTGWWVVVGALIGGDLGKTMQLGETTPAHSLVMPHVQRLMGMSIEDRAKFEHWAASK